MVFLLEALNLSGKSLLVIVVSAFLSGLLHGATGMAGGVVFAAILSHIVGIKLAIPIITCALVFSHSSRCVLYWLDVDWVIAKHVLIFGCPMIVIGAIIFGVLAPSTIALIFVSFLILSFPIKYWAKRHSIKTGPKLLAAASSIWGMLAGNVVGPGFFLAPFLLGTGMNRSTFVGTLATITLIMNLIKLSVFGVTQLINTQLFLLGAVVGFITIPGNYFGRMILKTMSDKDHGIIIDILTLLLIVNFLFLAKS